MDAELPLSHGAWFLFSAFPRRTQLCIVFRPRTVDRDSIHLILWAEINREELSA